MPAKSKAQQRLFGMAYCIRTGKCKEEDMPDKAVQLSKSKISLKSLRDFAKTKAKDLADKITKQESKDEINDNASKNNFLTFREFLKKVS